MGGRTKSRTQDTADREPVGVLNSRTRESERETGEGRAGEPEHVQGIESGPDWTEETQGCRRAPGPIP